MGAVIGGRRVALRPLREKDLDKLREWDEDEEIYRFSGKKFTGRGVAEWLATYDGRKARALGIADESGRLIGDLELENINWRRREAELRICLGEKVLWNRGYGTEAIEALLEHVFGVEEFTQVYLRVYGSNRRAIRCYEKCGFIPEGRLRLGGRTDGAEDILLMSITRGRFARHRARGERAGRQASGRA